MIFKIGGLISYVKSNSKVLYLLEFFNLRSFTFANLPILIDVSLRKLENKSFSKIVKSISKMYRNILITMVKTPVQTDKWIKSYHQKNNLYNIEKGTLSSSFWAINSQLLAVLTSYAPFWNWQIALFLVYIMSLFYLKLFYFAKFHFKKQIFLQNWHVFWW